MPEYRRLFVPGGTYFFTAVTYRRAKLFDEHAARALLGNVFRECRRDWPFEIPAIVLLPDHLHTVWSLRPGDSNYPARWSRIKKEFTRRWLTAGGCELPTTAGLRHEHRRGVWQRRYWEHTIEDEDDLQQHLDYIHYNPVKHGHVRCPHEWPWSSFHRWVAAGIYDRDWACWKDGSESPDFSRIAHTVGEPE